MTVLLAGRKHPDLLKSTEGIHLVFSTVDFLSASQHSDINNAIVNEIWVSLMSTRATISRVSYFRILIFG